MAKFYFDTDVWIAYLDEREEGHRTAVKLFCFIKKKKHAILVTRLHSEEASKAGFTGGFNSLEKQLFSEGVCFDIKPKLVDKFSAGELNRKLRVGFGDCLHVITAKRTDALAVSFDKHWQGIGAVLGKRVFTPEEALRELNI